MLNNKVVIVTGAGRGLGAAIARVCAKHGAAVAINYAASRDKAESLAADIRATGGNARTYAADVRDATAVNAIR